MTKDFVKGSTSEEKFASINQTLKHFSRRLHKTIIGVMPSIPVFGYVEDVPEDGVILRHLFLGKGRITRGYLCVEEYLDDKTVSFNVEIHGEVLGASYALDNRKTLLLVKPNLEVAAGDRLILRTELPPRIRKVWAGFLLDFGIGDMSKKPYLLDHFDKLVEEANNAEEEGEG